LPNLTTIRQSFADGDERVLVHIPSPISREECNVFWALAISPGFRGPAPESQISFATAVLNEDREMCENQIPHEVPVNPVKSGWGVLVTPGDTLRQHLPENPPPMAHAFGQASRGRLSTTSQESRTRPRPLGIPLECSMIEESLFLTVCKSVGRR